MLDGELSAVVVGSEPASGDKTRPLALVFRERVAFGKDIDVVTGRLAFRQRVEFNTPV